MTREDLLSQLKDISPPTEPAWWLPATGHLLIGLAALAAIALMLAWLWRRRGSRRLRRARDELRRIEARQAGDPDAGRLARELAGWLKRVSLIAFPERRPQGLTGEAWLAFLDGSIGADRFSRGPGRVFGADVYRRDPPLDADELLELCAQWLSGIAPRLRGGRGNA
ncbi:MAG: DUF4381 domain-containing protein [Gammaproteobacteria bacterium]|jgi:hypothetical protein